MVFLHQASSRKRPPTTTTTATATADATASAAPGRNKSIKDPRRRRSDDQTLIEKTISVLADAGCTLHNAGGPPCLPSDLHKLRRHLDLRFSSNAALLGEFLSGFNSYIQNTENLRRVLMSSSGDGSSRGDSLVRILLLVAPIQLQLQQMLLEMLPEYFDTDPSAGTCSLEEDVARLILKQFRWLDFIVDSKVFTDKLMEVLSICPVWLKKEIIGSLPEIIGDQNNEMVVDSLETMLQEDSVVIVPVLDTFSNLNLDDQQQEQVITIALSCIRTIDVEHMPYLVRFLLLSATPSNVRRIISQIREQLKFLGLMDTQSARNKKLKGKSPVDSTEASVLDALRSSLRFKNILCQEVLKELKCIERASDHKIIDVWLLMLIYANGGTLQKSVEKLFKKKIIDGCFQEAMFDQCVHGNKVLLQDYFPSFLSLLEYLLACKEQKAREFGIHIYTSLFEEFNDTYSRQEILGALVTHVGSGISYEVSSALETITLLALKYSQELLPLSSYINGILDYLEGFDVENLHKVYGVFSHLALFARSSEYSVGSSIANELLMIVQKQLSNPDLRYKKMGLIGTLKIVSCLGDTNNASHQFSSQKSNCDEALELLKISLDSCKLLPLPLILFYDELIAMLENKIFQPPIMEWMGIHVGEFESRFLSDLEGGQLSVKDSYCGLDGELWMNLDSDLSPICLSILPLVCSSSLPSSSLQILPANFLLLSVVERLMNQGSLGGIDALLGCPLHLPSPKYISGPIWGSLTVKQKQAVCLSLYYAANWIRELLNAFSTQVSGKFHCCSQATREETIAKLLKRLRNLVFIESLLNTSLKLYPLSLPELHLPMENCNVSRSSHLGHIQQRNEKKKTCENRENKRKYKNNSKASEDADINGKIRQPTILDVLRKAGAITSQEVPNKGFQALSHEARASQSEEHQIPESNEPLVIDVSGDKKVLETQRFKFRPLLVDCFTILSFSENQGSCCPDPAAELSLHLYLLQDLHKKLDCMTLPSKQVPARCLSAVPGLRRMAANDFWSKIRLLFSSIKKHLDSSIYILEEGTEACQNHWRIHSASAGNPDIPNMVISNRQLLGRFLEKFFAPSGRDTNVLLDLLSSFQPIKIPDNIFSGVQPIPSPGNVDYLYCGTYSFLEGVLDTACSFSFSLASEVLVSLESLVISAQKLLDDSHNENNKNTRTGFAHGVLPILRNRLGNSAHKLLMYNWENGSLEDGWKSKGELIEKILQIYLESSDSTSDLLDELAGSILPQVPCKTKTTQDDVRNFPTLSSATFTVWYRVLHEENLTFLNKLVKEVIMLEKPRANVQCETVERVLTNLRQSVSVVVSLVNMCKTYDKVTIHAMAVKYGGKFVELFLKAFDFLQIHFQVHNDIIIQLVKELQKATRIIQTLCSEAKGLKQTTITTKIPATKRSMERFLFRVKALLHTTSNGCTFWMGNLKHKDLLGQVISSQLYTDENDSSEANENMEADVEDEAIAIGNEGDRET